MLEVEAELDGFGSRSNEVRSAEGGQVIIQRGFVGQVDDREAQTPFVAVTVEKIVVANGKAVTTARFTAPGTYTLIATATDTADRDLSVVDMRYGDNIIYKTR